MYLKEYLKAIEEFSIALKINERDSTHNDLGVAFLKAGMLKEAEKEILISMSNEKTDCRYNSLAAVYFEMGRYIESFHAILSSIAIKPNAYTNDNLFEILYKIKSVDNIINECKSFLHKNPHFSDMNYLIATLLDYVGGQGHESEEYYQRIVGMMKNNPQFSERLTPYGQSSNPVRVDLSNPFSHNMFFIKCDDKKRDKIFEMRRLEREFATAAFVSETLRSYNNKARTGEPVAFFDHDDGNIYLISKAQGSRNLRELSADVGFQDSAIEDNVTKCLLNLADIQGYVTRELNGRNDFRVARNGNNYHIKLDRFDYDHDLDRRIFDRFSHNKSSDKVKKLMQGIINANRTGQDFFIHGDMV
ncbi:MAG: hypothetical protein NT001_04605, partial [Candidatus Woesearchaeota archaeon]|nr:hypothetical protein [Candidatus Woesearchaeota archaeon]